MPTESESSAETVIDHICLFLKVSCEYLAVPLPSQRRRVDRRLTERALLLLLLTGGTRPNVAAGPLQIISLCHNERFMDFLHSSRYFDI